MAEQDHTPVFLLATANFYEDQRWRKQLHQEASLVHKLLSGEQARGACRLIREEPENGIFLFDQVRQFRHNPQVRLLHIAGFSRGEYLHLQSGFGESGLRPREVAQLVGQLPGLQLLFLNGCATPALLEALLPCGIPAIIVTRTEHHRKLQLDLARLFYGALAEGRSLEQAFSLLHQRYPERFSLHQVHYDLETDVFAWDQPSDAGPDTLVEGVYVLAAPSPRLDWTLPVARPALPQAPPQDPGKRQRQIRRIGSSILILAILAAMLVLLEVPARVQSYLGWGQEASCQFEQAATYNILQLPFVPPEGCEAIDFSLNQAIKRRLEQLEAEQGDFQVRYLAQATCPLEAPEASRYISECLADLVLWATYEPLPEGQEMLVQFQYYYLSDPNTVSQGEMSLPMSQGLLDREQEFIQSPIEDVVFWTRGERYFAQGDYGQAARYFSAMRRREDSAYLRVAIRLAQCYTRTNDLVNAKAQYDWMLRIDPGLATAYNERAAIFVRMENFENALVDYNKALRLQPDYPEAYYNRSLLYLRMAAYDKALQDIEAVLSARPDDASALGVRAAAYAGLGEEAQFYPALEKALAEGFRPGRFDLGQDIFASYAQDAQYQSLVGAYP